MNVSVPFLKRPVGAGDLVKAATSAVGIQPCTPCQQRAAKMNRALTFTPSKSKPHQVNGPKLEGYTLIAACTKAALYHNGRTYQVLSLNNGQLAASGARGFSDESLAAVEMGERCR